MPTVVKQSPTTSSKNISHPNRRLSLELALVLFVSLSLTLTFLIRRLILKPIKTLNRHAREIGQGDFLSMHYPDNGDELSRLGTTMNTMAGDILASQKKIEQQQEALNNMIGELQRSKETAVVQIKAKVNSWPT